MLRGMLQGLKLAAPLLALWPTQQLFAADKARLATPVKQNAAAVAPDQNQANNPADKVNTPTTTTTVMPMINHQAGRRYYRHHGRGRHYYTGKQQNVSRAKVATGNQFNNTKTSGAKVAKQQQHVQHHHSTVTKAPKAVQKTSHKQAHVSHHASKSSGHHHSSRSHRHS